MFKKIQEVFEGCTLDGDKVVIGSNLAKTIDFIKKNYDFDMLKEITATDKGEQGTELIYNLYSTGNNEDVKLSFYAKNEAESVSKIYDSATADEKEIYDLFGIKFTGNDELERLYMPQDWKGNPLKKDYSESDERA